MTISGEEGTAATADVSIAPPGDGAAREDGLVLAGAQTAVPAWLLPLAPVVIAAISVAMLWSGGAAAGFGAWLLAAGFPIVLGGVTRKPHFAVAPALIWAGWLIVVAATPEPTDIAQTPVPLALTLAAVGVGATLLAQRAISPALERAAWLPPQPRLAPSIDEALEAEVELDDEEAELDELVAEVIAEEAELEADEDDLGDATIDAAALEVDDAADDAEHAADADADVADEPEAEADADADADADAEDADEDDAADEDEEIVTSEELGETYSEPEPVAVSPTAVAEPPLPAATQAGRRWFRRSAQ